MLGTSGTKREAVKLGRRRAKAQGGRLVIHYSDGAVQRTLDYHDDH